MSNSIFMPKNSAPNNTAILKNLSALLNDIKKEGEQEMEGGKRRRKSKKSAKKMSGGKRRSKKSSKSTKSSSSKKSRKSKSMKGGRGMNPYMVNLMKLKKFIKSDCDAKDSIALTKVAAKYLSEANKDVDKAIKDYKDDKGAAFEKKIEKAEKEIAAKRASKKANK
jgi:hypothetical protein